MSYTNDERPQNFDLGEQIELMRDDPTFIASGLELEFTEKLCVRMNDLGYGRTRVASRAGVSRKKLKKLLLGNIYLKLADYIRVCQALDLELIFDCRPKTETSPEPTK